MIKETGMPRTANLFSLILPLLAAGCANLPSASTPPPLEWTQGNVVQLLSQPVERFYVATIAAQGGNMPVRLCHPYTGAARRIDTDDTLYDLLGTALLEERRLEVGDRDFGPDPPSGIHKRCVDRISLRP